MRFTIVTINYNNICGLKRTIDSVTIQSHKDYEWIVIDGGSTDGSKELIEQYASHFSYWVSEPDKGVYNAMNKGLKRAKGEYTIFLNSGDCFANPNVLTDVVQELNCDIVTGWVKEDKTGIVRKPPVELTLWHLFHNNIPHQAEFIRRSLFEEIAMYSEDLKVIADFEFNIRAALRDCTYKTINKYIAIIEPGGISNTELSLMKREGDIIKSRNLPLSIREDYANWMEREKELSSPQVVWAINKRWPLKVLRVLYKLFG